MCSLPEAANCSIAFFTIFFPHSIVAYTLILIRNYRMKICENDTEHAASYLDFN